MTTTEAPAEATQPAVKKRNAPTGEQRTELARQAAQRYAAGASIREVSTELGLSYGLTHHLLLEQGVKLRPRSARPAK